MRVPLFGRELCMTQLAVPRVGWENEHLAEFLLSRISFVAQPVSVGDDIGSDFFCTLFTQRPGKNGPLLFPVNSFAIQIKSNRKPVKATNKIDYLWGLELPFFVGVISRKDLSISIFAGDLLPLCFTHHGRPDRLTLKLVDRLPAQDPYTATTVSMPLVARVSAGDSDDELECAARKLSCLSARMHANLASRTSHEYIFTAESPDRTVIFAGEASAQTFRRNLLLRLAEVFQNLLWLNDNSHDVRAEFEVYDEFANALCRHGYLLPPEVTTPREQARASLKGSG